MNSSPSSHSEPFSSRALCAVLLLALGAFPQCWSGEVTIWTSSLTLPGKSIQVFPRSQCHKYFNFLNVLHWWNDRPLIYDRSLRPAIVDGVLVTPGSDVLAVRNSLVRDAELAKEYLVDGLGSFGSTNYQEPSYEFYLDSVAASATTGYKHLLEISSLDLTYLRPALTKALASSYSARISGKVLISSYALDANGPTNIAAQRQVLRNEFGDTFVLVVEMTAVSEEMLRLYKLGELSTSPSAKLTELKQALRQYLDAADGIMVENCHHMETNTAHRYDNRFDLGFYRDCLIPIFKSVLAEPAYAGKLLGLGVASGYCNNRTGDNNSEECTRRLRNTFDVAISAAPDFIVIPEWNEQNENTALQPTVNNSWTHRRITEYYMRTIKGLPLSPRAGDDTSLPNCVLSYRKEIKLGETLELEILNVPDSTATTSYTAVLSLEDVAGNVVKTFAPVSFVRNVLRDYTMSVPSESLAAHAAIRPVITIQQATSRTIKDGLLHITLRPAWTLDYQTVKQPLRDLAPITSATLTAVAGAGHTVTLTGTVNASEALTSVEVMAEASEVYAYDRLNEYDLANNVVIYGYYTSLPDGYDCDLTVTGTSTFQLKPVYMPENSFQYQKIGNVMRFSSAPRGREWPARFYLVIPKASTASAVIQVSSSHGNFAVPVASLLSNGVFRKTVESQMVFNFEVFHRLPDHPVPINATSANFTTTLQAETAQPVYHLRIITQSSRIYRTKPQPVSFAATGTASLKVFSESLSGSAVTVSVPRSGILDLNYEFDNRCGDVLPVAAGVRWCAQMGGGTLYAEPFYSGDYSQRFYTGSGYPASGPLSKPSWVNEDGASCLQFSGNGQYLILPPEAFPRGAFVLSCDIKPMVSTPQILFRHHGILIGSLMLKLANGKLYASHVDKLIQESYFDTGLVVPVGQWSRITVTYDLATLAFSVEGQPLKSYPFTGKALYFQTSVFGGHLRPGFGVDAGDGFFNGYLKSLRITHSSTRTPPATNSTPVANGQSLTTPQNTARNLTLTGSDLDGDPLTTAVTSSPVNGTLSGAAPLLVYTPTAGFIGSDSFIFTVNDGQATSAPATIQVTVIAPGAGGGGGSSGSSSSGSGGGGCGLGGAAAALLLGLALGLRLTRRRW